MASIPLFKVGALVLRTLAKPLASRMMAEAKSHPAVAKVCVTFGQFMHQVTSRVYILASGYRVVGVNPLPVEEALTNGVAIASEFIVFCVAGTILVVEYKMSERSSSAKAAAAKKEKDEAQQELDDRFETLDTKILVLAERLQSLEKAIAAQEQRHTKGGVPLGWIFGSGNGQSKTDSDTNSLGNIGKNDAHLPEMLEDNEVIEDAADSAVRSGATASTENVVSSAAATISTDETSIKDITVPTEAGAVANDKVTTRTWYDWVTWK